jgi:hypothetical protein
MNKQLRSATFALHDAIKTHKYSTILTHRNAKACVNYSELSSARFAKRIPTDTQPILMV